MVGYLDPSKKVELIIGGDKTILGKRRSLSKEMVDNIINFQRLPVYL